MPKKFQTINAITKEPVTVTIDDETIEMIKKSEAGITPVIKIVDDYAVTVYVDKNITQRGSQTGILAKDPSIADLLDLYCSNEDKSVAGGSPELAKAFDSGCATRAANTAVNEILSLARDTSIVLNRRAKSVKRLVEENDVDNASVIEKKMKSAKEAMKDFVKKMGDIRTDIDKMDDIARKNIALKDGGSLETYKKMEKARQELKERIEATTCKKRTIRMLWETCKEKGITGCYSLSKAQLVKLLC